MGERANGVGTAARPPGARSLDAREEARRLEGEISALREDLGGLVAELDRRRHELMDVKLQLRRHARGAAVTGLGLAGGIALLVMLRVRRARARRRPPSVAEWIAPAALGAVRQAACAVARLTARPR